MQQMYDRYGKQPVRINNGSGQPFSEYIKDHQLRKVGMKRTESAGFAHFEDVIPHQARGYTYDITGELTTVYAQFPPFLRATAGMSSNAKAIAMWSIALQKGGFSTKRQACLHCGHQPY
jgi:CubicO group peptidase (beta-lactamase class C family)